MSARRHPGRFQKGADPRRHVFTRDECQRGFAAACQSLARRYPGCDPHFLLCAKIGSKPWFLLPQVLSLTGEESEAELQARFARD